MGGIGCDTGVLSGVGLALCGAVSAVAGYFQGLLVGFMRVRLEVLSWLTGSAGYLSSLGIPST